MKNAQLSISNDISELVRLQAFIENLAESWNLPAKTVMNINLVLEEIVTNTINYGYGDDAAEHKIFIDFTLSEKDIRIVISDDGREFNMEEAEKFTDQHKSAEEREIGGLGIHFVRTMMDEVEYRREKGQNIITLTRKL